RRKSRIRSKEPGCVSRDQVTGCHSGRVGEGEVGQRGQRRRRRCTGCAARQCALCPPYTRSLRSNARYSNACSVTPGPERSEGTRKSITLGQWLWIPGSPFRGARSDEDGYE